jgi:adenylate cyclase class 2
MGTAGGLESEIKLRVAGVAQAHTRLAAAGAVLARAREFEDNLLLDDAGLSLAGEGCVLRVRRTRPAPAQPVAAPSAGGADAGGARLTFKGPRRVEGGIKSREEIELSVSDAGGLLELLARLGYTRRFRYQKYRETWRLGAVEVVVDETPVGCFFEIEGAPEAIPAAAAALGYGPRDFVTASYVALHFAAGGQGDMVFA